MAPRRRSQQQAALQALPPAPAPAERLQEDQDEAAPQDGVAEALLKGQRCVLEALEPPSAKGNNFVKGLRWSPDGATLLASHDDAIMRLYAVPADALDAGLPPGTGPGLLGPYASAAEGGPVLDFCFFPSFSWAIPGTCCFITSSQDHPIHLREAVGGTLWNTYRPFNQVDEVCHAFSLCFSPDGSRILGGFPQYIRVFDVQRPGRQVEDWLLSTRKGRGQKGIIGALAAATESPGLYAAGSYNRNACVYHHGGRGKPVAWLVDKEPDYEMGGVTQLAWAGEWLLLSGHRRDRWLRAWDLRMAGGSEDSAGGLRPKALLHRFPRSARTHQRFMFSVAGTRLATGDDEGRILMYSLQTLLEVGRIEQAHGRPCVAAALHPTTGAAVVTGSGGRAFPDHDIDSPPPLRSGDEEPSAGGAPVKRRRDADPHGGAAGAVGGRANRCPPGHLDNSVRVWRLDWQ